jgi:hypothetical protein
VTITSRAVSPSPGSGWRPTRARPNHELAAELGVCKTTIGEYYRAAGIKKTPLYHSREQHVQLPARCERQRRRIVLATWTRVSRAWAEGQEGDE